MFYYQFQARIEQMRTNVAIFLRSLPYNEAEIGMLEFSSSATELVPVIPLDSDDNLKALLENIPTVASGGTCIGCGIEEAIEVNF